ncbi:MAG TPA: spore germination protein GerW family protein [Terriglobales bacterium]|nr:spore germination protein GerW family protein [Terriglobales bacterium]
MEIQSYFQSLQETLRTSAHVKTVYGEPISAEGRTIVPVARIRYGFGGGFGQAPNGQSNNQDASREGGGGGGGIVAVPVGVIEVSNQGTRFIPIQSRRKLALAAAVGVFLGSMVGRRRRSR